VPFGVRLIDTSDWPISTLDPRPSVMHVSGQTVPAYGTRWFGDRRPSESTGLLAFDGAGSRRFTRFRGQQIATVHTSRRIPFLLTPRS
jgi:hypothetical protein